MKLIIRRLFDKLHGQGPGPLRRPGSYTSPSENYHPGESMRSFATTLLVLLVAVPVLGQTTDLIISEYVEGSGSNKAVEIHNGTGDIIALGEYSLAIYFNGNTVASTIALDGVLMQPGDTHVLVAGSAEEALLALADQVYGGSMFNGNDVVVLERGGQVVDSLGTIGVDPGTSWNCPDGTAHNHTLRRQSSVCHGDTDPFDVFDLCAEWTFFPSDAFDGLGSHETDCYSVGSGDERLGSIKALFR